MTNGVIKTYTKFTDTLGITMVLLLVFQYVLGMFTALYIEIPEETSGWQFMGSSMVLISHVTLGILLAGVSIWLLAASIMKRSGTWIVSSALGLAGILLSLMTGSAFMNDQSDNNSFLMALGLAISLLAYSAGIYLSSTSRNTTDSARK